MVKIRLARVGAKKHPIYRLVVTDGRSPRNGRFLEEVGHYDPSSTPATVRIEREKIEQWLVRGAQPSETARKLLVREGVLKAQAVTRPQQPQKKGTPTKEAHAVPAEETTSSEKVSEEAAEGASEE